MGGPNFPVDFPSQGKFMEMHQEIDVYVPIDGEIGFSNVIEAALQVDSEKEIIQKVLEKPIDGCVSRNANGKLQFSIPSIRTKNLDEIPSPYLTGLMDKFFDDKLVPMIQTNRGCPFKCTFCTDGKDEVNQVNNFSLQRVKQELEYIAEHVPNNTHSLHISDLNFGMYPRDVEICDHIRNIQKKYNFPSFIKCTTGKNQKEKIILAIEKLSSSLRMTMSVQSMDDEVLKNIRRDNISVDHMLALYPAMKDANLQTSTEVILGLPGETYESHLQTLRDLVKGKMDEILVHTCILLDGSELNTPQERKKWKFETKFRVIPKDFAKLSNGRKVVETEEIIVGSNTLTFDEYVELRVLAFIIFVTNMAVVYDALLKFLREQNVGVFELYYKMLKQLERSPKNIHQIFDRLKKSTINELWNSKEEIIEHYQDENEYNKLLNGEDGINTLQIHHAIVIGEYMDEWINYTLEIAHELIREKTDFNEELENKFRSVVDYCRGVSYNIFGTDRLKTIPKYDFKFDIPKWLDDKNQTTLDNFKLSTITKISFILSDDQYKVVQDNLELYGDNPNGRSQAIKRIPKTMLWRKPIRLQTITR